MDRYFGCSFFTTFFLREKESGGKKSAHKRGLRRDSLRSYSAQFPPYVSPYDCSADSDLTSYRPKRSASIMPPVSYLENARIRLSFFTHGWLVHPMPQFEQHTQFKLSFGRGSGRTFLCRSLSNILNLSCLAVWTSAFAINAKHVFFAVPCIIIYCHRRYLALSAAECASWCRSMQRSIKKQYLWYEQPNALIRKISVVYLSQILLIVLKNYYELGDLWALWLVLRYSISRSLTRKAGRR